VAFYGAAGASETINGSRIREESSESPFMQEDEKTFQSSANAAASA